MSSPRFRHQPRKSINDFLSENIPNQIIYKCLKDNVGLSDPTILDAFNNAYSICIEVIANPDLHTARSENFKNAFSINQDSLLANSIAFALLSFHEKAPILGRFLNNLKELLYRQFEDIFQPLLIATSALTPILKNSVSFLPPSYVAETPIISPDKQYISIPKLMQGTKELPKSDAMTVLSFLRRNLLEAYGDWGEVLAMEMDRVSRLPESAPTISRYRIAKDHQTTFVKLLKIICQTHIFETTDGKHVSNFEDFIRDIASFLNTDIKNPSSLLAASRRTENFMAIFDTIHDYALDYYTKEDALDQKRANNQSRFRQGEFF